MKKSVKSAQMKLSFGMIFSIILIIIFIAFAFYAINKFLGIKCHADVALFLDDLQNDIDDVWQSTNRAKPISYSAPCSVEEVCFRSDGKLVFEPSNAGEGLTPYTLNHFDAEKTTSGRDVVCVEKVNGKIPLTIKIDPGDSLVTITGQ